jgi:hypothetical protein
VSIKSGQIIGPIAIAATDTVLAGPVAAGAKYEFYNLALHNTGAVTTTNIEIFVSADGTSSAGERVRYAGSVGANATVPLDPIGVPAGYYLIAKGSATGINFDGLYTIRDGEQA